jgi:hypothetical protein
MQPYRISILAAGGGHRFGDKSTFGHKALFRVGPKAVISHIIDLFPADAEFVIALGHNGSLIQQYLDMFYARSRRAFIYVPSGHYGPGYGPGYSLKQCREHLQVPFYSFACDTIVQGFRRDEASNWVGYSRIAQEDTAQYCTLQIDAQSSVVSHYFDKQKSGTDKAWIGLAFIRDYVRFWEAMDENHTFINEELQLFPALFALGDVQAKWFPTWYDTGTEEGLQIAKEAFQGLDNLDKVGEEIYFGETSVIKYFYDRAMVASRVSRARALGDVVPAVEDVSDNFYKYTFVPGADLFRVEQLDAHILPLLEFLQTRLWQDIALDKGEAIRFQSACRIFYHAKTLSRLEQLHTKLHIADRAGIINDLVIPSLEEMLEHRIDWEWLCDGIPSTFHGDCNLSNIILAVDGSFKLIDYRQDFGGNAVCGDRYYDLAKLYHSFLWPHPSAKRGHFELSRRGANAVSVSIVVPEALEASRCLVEEWSNAQGYDVRKIRVLASLVLLNISPLHEAPLDEHLYFLGKYHLYRCVCDQ